MSETDEIEATFSLASRNPIPVLKQTPVQVDTPPVGPNKEVSVATKKPSARAKTTTKQKPVARLSMQLCL